MNGELIIENYIAEDDSFESFYKKNRGKIKEALQGRKMKKRHLYNAKKLLGAIFLIPEAEQKKLILEAIKDSVADSNEEGFEGGEFDHFGFAKKLRQKAERLVKRKVDLLSLKNLRNRLFHKKQTPSPQPETTAAQVNPGLRMRATEAKAQVIANNSKLASPTVTTPTGGGSVNDGGDSEGDAGGQGDGSGDDNNKTTPDQVGGDDKTKTTEEKQTEKKTTDSKKAADDKSKDTNTKDENGADDDKNKKSRTKKWLLIGGGTAVLVIIIIVVIALSKGSTHATTVITK